MAYLLSEISILKHRYWRQICHIQSYSWSIDWFFIFPFGIFDDTKSIHVTNTDTSNQNHYLIQKPKSKKL